MSVRLSPKFSATVPPLPSPATCCFPSSRVVHSILFPRMERDEEEQARSGAGTGFWKDDSPFWCTIDQVDEAALVDNLEAIGRAMAANNKKLSSPKARPYKGFVRPHCVLLSSLPRRSCSLVDSVSSYRTDPSLPCVPTSCIKCPVFRARAFPHVALLLLPRSSCFPCLLPLPVVFFSFGSISSPGFDRLGPPKAILPLIVISSCGLPLCDLLFGTYIYILIYVLIG